MPTILITSKIAKRINMIWIRLPAIRKAKPSIHRINKIINIVQSTF